jgi:hypothetical protein
MDYVDQIRKMETLRRGYKISPREKKASKLMRDAVVLMVIAAAILIIAIIKGV